MKRIEFLLLLTLLLGLVEVSNAQNSNPREAEYRIAFREAFTKSRTFSRRQFQKIKSVSDGQVREEEWMYEYQLPDRVRMIHVETLGGKSRRTEQINIGETKYCKRDNEDWSVVKSYCIGGSGSGGPSKILSNTYRREDTKLNGKKAVLFQEYTTWMNSYSKTAGTDGPSFWETKFWVDGDGKLLRYETRQGLVSNAHPGLELVETYEYDSSININTPIK